MIIKPSGLRVMRMKNAFVYENLVENTKIDNKFF